MKPYFDIHFDQLAQLLLPPWVRKPYWTSILRAMYAPLTSTYQLFVSNRDANLYNWSITPQVCLLERLLNDRFDTVERQIYISDGVYYEAGYLYTDAESLDQYLYTEAEHNPLATYTKAETGADGADFVVHIPAHIPPDNQEMRALLDMYKLASKRYIRVHII